MRKKKALLHRSKDGQFYYTLHGTNGKVLCTSETVKRKLSLLTALENNFPDFIIVDKT